MGSVSISQAISTEVKEIRQNSISVTIINSIRIFNYLEKFLKKLDERENTKLTLKADS